MADNGITKQEMQELFEKFFGTSTGARTYDPDDVEAFTRQMKLSVAELKKSQPGIKQFGDFLNGTKQPIQDVREELKKFDEQIERATRTAKSSEDVAAVSALQAQKREMASAAAARTTKAALGNLAIGAGEVAATMTQGAVDFVKGLQDGASGTQLSTRAAVNFAKAGGDAAKAVGGFGQAIGTAMMMIGGPWVKAIGAAIEVIGLLVDFFGGKSAKAMADAAELVGKELEKTQKAFQEITAAGAVFGGGMTEMRQRAYEAGLDIAQLSTVVKASREEMTMMGIGLGEATKRVAGVSKELRNSDLGIQLRKLGYSAEEQAELSAGVMANMSAAGNSRAINDKQVAEQTAKYGKDLKVLADITGQDAKKAMDKARTQAMEADVLAQAQAEGGADAVKKLQRQLALMPEVMKKGYLEFVSTGGSAIADAATNVAITQNPKIMEQYRAQYDALKNQNIDASQAQDQTSKLTEETAQYQRDHVKEQRSMAQAARLASDSVSGGVKGAVDIQNALIMTNAKLQKGTTQGARDAADAAAKNLAPLDVATAELEENTQKLKAALGKELTSTITGFASASAKGLETLDEALSKFGVETKGASSRREAKAEAARKQTTASTAAGDIQYDEMGNAVSGGPTSATPATPGTTGGPGAGTGKSAEDLIKFNGGITGNKSNFDNLNADFKSKFMAMIAEYGKPVTITSGARTAEEQALIDSGNNPKAKPGHSLHNFGRAIDLNTPDVNGLKAAGLLQKYGFQGLNNDPVHIQMADKGASLGANDVAIVGEKGPEIVQGSGSVTSRASTSEIFSKMNSNLETMIRLLKDQHSTSEKILWAQS
jgi:hypothetical protein